MEKVIIYATPQEIAEALLIFMQKYERQKPEPTFENDRMSVSEASRFAGVSYRTFCLRIKAGDIPVHGSGRTRFILKSELLETLRNL